MQSTKKISINDTPYSYQNRQIQSRNMDHVKLITQHIDCVGKIVQEYLSQRGELQSNDIDQLKQQLYSTTFNMIFEKLQSTKTIQSHTLFDSASTSGRYSLKRNHEQLHQSSTLEVSQFYLKQNDVQNDDQQVEIQNIISNLLVYLKEFKKETLQQIVDNSKSSMFDFILSQQFNDFWDILTTCENQMLNNLPENIQQQTDPCNKLNNSQCYYYDKCTLKQRSKSQQETKLNKCLETKQELKKDQLAQIKNQQEIEFALTLNLVSQLIDTNSIKSQIKKAKDLKQHYDQRLEETTIDEKQPDSNSKEYQIMSPTQMQRRTMSCDLPQLFSFDSSFVKDLPLQKHIQISNFDSNFTLTMGGPDQTFLHGTLANISGIIHEDEELSNSHSGQTQHTSRFEEHHIDNQNRNYQTDNHQKFKKKTNYSLKSVEEKEKLLATRELKMLVEEKSILQANDVINFKRAQLEQEQQNFIQSQEEFMFFRQEEMTKIQETTIRLEEMKLNLEKKYKIIDKENSLSQMNQQIQKQRQKQKQDVQIGNLKGNLKNIIQRMNQI